jgi:hypothetical protein
MTVGPRCGLEFCARRGERARVSASFRAPGGRLGAGLVSRRSLLRASRGGLSRTPARRRTSRGALRSGAGEHASHSVYDCGSDPGYGSSRGIPRCRTARTLRSRLLRPGDSCPELVQFGLAQGALCPREYLVFLVTDVVGDRLEQRGDLRVHPGRLRCFAGLRSNRASSRRRFRAAIAAAPVFDRPYPVETFATLVSLH